MSEALGGASRPWPLAARLAASLLVVLAAVEGSVRVSATGLLGGPGGLLLRRLLAPVWARYLPVRGWVLEHRLVSALCGLVALVLLALVYRWWLLLWNNQVKARLSGTHFAPEDARFPIHTFDLVEEIRSRPKGTSFIGMQASRGVLGWRWRPFRIDARQRSMHCHVLGKTGSGKTQSVIWPLALQDALDGKGVLVMDAKGSDENVRMMKTIAALAGRERELKVFALPAWNNPAVWSHSYNMLHVRPRSTTWRGGDVVAVAERVFSILPLGDNEYYNTQAQVMFTNVCRLLHGMVDEKGNGRAFTVNDVAFCLKGIGAVDGHGTASPFHQALTHCLATSLEQAAAREIRGQISRLGHDARKCFSGVVGALDKFTSPLVNAYAPDIVFEDVLERGGLVYVQLPGNLFKIQAPALGRVLLMDVQQEGSLRQVERTTRSQAPFSVTVDEFYNFADLSIVDSLNKLRDANLSFTLAHQSIADLELVSKEFAVAVWDNTRTKVILSQDNPQLCEQVSKSVGTHQIVEKTVRSEQGHLFTSLVTGDASTKLVETFRLHPNAIKGLAPCGQGYCYFGTDIVPLALEMLPPLGVDYPLERNDQAAAPGLRLEESFSGGAGHPLSATRADASGTSIPHGGSDDDVF